MAAPYSTTNTQFVTSAQMVQLASGAVLNLGNVMWMEREGVIVKIRTVDGRNFDQKFETVAKADAYLLAIVQATNPVTVGSPYIAGITPATAVNGTLVTAVVRGQGFLPGGTMTVGPDVAALTFVDSFTLKAVFTGSVPASTVNVVWTSPDLVTTATLVNGFVWT